MREDDPIIHEEIRRRKQTAPTTNDISGNEIWDLRIEQWQRREKKTAHGSLNERCVDSEVARAKICQDAFTRPSPFAAIFNGKAYARHD